MAECLETDAPLSWTNGSFNRNITLFLKRLYIGSAPRATRDQYYILSGGPGGSGESLEQIGIVALQRWFRHQWGSDPSSATVDIYLPDHRGTGHSHRLWCPSLDVSGPPNVTACLAEMRTLEGGDDGLAQFNPTNAALDLKHLISLTKGTGRVWVHGLSYGSFLAQRYLAVAPTQASGVVLDGVCPPDHTRFVDYDFNFGEVGLTLLERCAADPVCALHFHDRDPLLALYTIREHITAGHSPCADALNLTLHDLSLTFARLLPDSYARPLIPALIARLARCLPSDFDAWSHLLALVRAPGMMPACWSSPLNIRFDMDSPITQNNIILGEMWTGKPSPSATIPSCDELQALSAHSYFAEFDVPATCTDWLGIWPRYAPDPYTWGYPDPAALPKGFPVLMLNGNLDSQTPLFYAREVAQHYTDGGKWLVEIPLSGHTPLISSPLPQGYYPDDFQYNDTTTCGFEILSELVFAKDLTVPPPRRCLAAVQPVDFGGLRPETRQCARTMFASEDLWHEVLAVVSPAVPASGAPLVWRSGGRYSIAWRLALGPADPPVHALTLSLYRGGVHVVVIADSVPPTPPEYLWSIPASVAPGDGYEIRVGNATELGVEAVLVGFSPLFQVAPLPACPSSAACDACLLHAGCGFCAAAALCVPGDDAGPNPAVAGGCPSWSIASSDAHAAQCPAGGDQFGTHATDVLTIVFGVLCCALVAGLVTTLLCRRRVSLRGYRPVAPFQSDANRADHEAAPAKDQPTSAPPTAVNASLA